MIFSFFMNADELIASLISVHGVEERSYGVRVKGQSKPTEMVNTFLLSGAEIADRLKRNPRHQGVSQSASLRQHRTRIGYRIIQRAGATSSQLNA